MTARFDADEFTAALRDPRNATRAAHQVPVAPGSAPAGDEWQQREEFKLKVISARVKLKLMRDRTEALKEALARFRTQQDAMRA
ncbi:MAG TPA: hypothetical protein VF422_02480 [Dokdonella sp.]